jgi:hypothetical protein
MGMQRSAVPENLDHYWFLFSKLEIASATDWRAFPEVQSMSSKESATADLDAEYCEIDSACVLRR